MAFLWLRDDDLPHPLGGNRRRLHLWPWSVGRRNTSAASTRPTRTASTASHTATPAASHRPARGQH